MTFVVICCLPIWILPLIPSFFLPPAPTFNSQFLLCTVVQKQNIIWVTMSCYDAYRHCCIGQDGLGCAAVTNSPLLMVSKHQRSVCCSRYRSSSLAWQVPFFTGIQACRLMIYEDTSSRESKGSSTPKQETSISGHSSGWVTGLCPITRGSGNVFLPRS